MVKRIVNFFQRGVNGGGFDARTTRQLLNDVLVGARFQLMRGVTVPQIVQPELLIQPRRPQTLL